MKNFKTAINSIRIIMLMGFMFLSCSTQNQVEYKAQSENPEFIHRSIKQVTDVIVHDVFSPPVASRIYAYVTVAGYEAARYGDNNLISLAGQLKGLNDLPKPDQMQEYSYTLAASQAILQVGTHLIFSEDQMEEFHNTLLEEFLNTGMPDDVYQRSIMFGNKVADAVIEWSNKDNYKQTRSFPKYTVTDEANTWKPTPPAYMDAIEPHWNKIRTFVMDSAQQFKPTPITPFSVEKESQFYKEAMETYTVGNTLTDEQRDIAFFWDCNPFIMNVKGHVMFATKKISPGGHWINITHVACIKEKSNYASTSEAYVRVAIALADAFISCWDEKYRSNVIRPETYINNHIDADWVPVLQTPPFPEYTSGHSVISAAAATMLTDLFGESFSFTDSTEIEFGLKARSFTSFKAASDEAAISRLYGGIHYRPACIIGVDEGRAIGDYILTKLKTRQEKLENIN